MNAIQIVRDSEQFPQMERIDENQVIFYFDHSSRSYGEGTQYMAVMVNVETESDDIDEIKALALPVIKEYRLNQVSEYDRSSAVNEFTYGGVSMWLDKETRNGLLMRFNAESAAGKTSTTIWYGTMSFTLTPTQGIAMVNALELYASACYDKTAEHKANIQALDDADEAIAYDYTADYPEKLAF